MSLQRFLVSAGAVAALASTVLFALDSAAPRAEPGPGAVVALDVPAPEALDAASEAELALAAANWTNVGCISLSGDCLDVFVDNKGVYWVCLACGTTQNPGPGKCRKLTAYELANALWCA
jgi:hypothetical protein